MSHPLGHFEDLCVCAALYMRRSGWAGQCCEGLGPESPGLLTEVGLPAPVLWHGPWTWVRAQSWKCSVATPSGDGDAPFPGWVHVGVQPGVPYPPEGHGEPDGTWALPGCPQGCASVTINQLPSVRPGLAWILGQEAQCDHPMSCARRSSEGPWQLPRAWVSEPQPPSSWLCNPHLAQGLTSNAILQLQTL